MYFSQFWQVSKTGLFYYRSLFQKATFSAVHGTGASLAYTSLAYTSVFWCIFIDFDVFIDYTGLAYTNVFSRIFIDFDAFIDYTALAYTSVFSCIFIDFDVFLATPA